MQHQGKWWLAVAGLLGVGAFLCFLAREPGLGALAGGLGLVMLLVPTPEWFDG